MKRIDPYGTFEVSGPKLAPSKISIGVGAYCRPDLCWYVGWDRSNAELAKSPCRLGHQTSADLRGAGLSALMGAAAAAKEALNIETTPATVSAWNLQSGGNSDPGPSELPTINVGRGLMIGAGAVANAAVYWLMQWGNVSPWNVVGRGHRQIAQTQIDAYCSFRMTRAGRTVMQGQKSVAWTDIWPS